MAIANITNNILVDSNIDVNSLELLSNKSTTTSLGTSDTLYPTQNAVKVYADTKVDKVTTSGVERVYTINADGSQGVKATSDLFTDLYPIKYWYQATGVGILQTYGTNAIFASATQSDLGGVVSYRRYLTTTALGNLAIVRESSFARLNSGRGFNYEMHFKLENTAAASNWRGLFGFRTTSTPTNVDPTSDFQPFLGIGADAGDTNLFFISKLFNSPISKVNTGIAKSTTDELLLEIKRLNGTNSNELTLKNLTTGNTVTTIFINDGINTITNYMSNNTSAQAIGFSISRIRLNVSE
jgi:hypothetical protein